MVKEAALKEFRASLRGDVLTPVDAGYDASRQIFNTMIDRRPAIIARCARAADVVTCVVFARTQGLDVSVRGGGHSVAGKAVCDGALMVDLGTMKGIRVDPGHRSARAEPGLRLGDFDRACQAFGLASPTGVASDTGIAGLTLGGGIGWLNGKYGLACDNLLSVDIVTADARLRVASPTEDADLFWAVRGAGANFGIVTSFEYRLHPVGPVLGGGVVYPLAKARQVLRFYQDFTEGCPDDLSTTAAFRREEDGTPVVEIGVAWCGPHDEGERLLGRLRSFDVPIADTIASMGYVDLQSRMDPAFPSGRRHYWKSGFLRCLEPAAIDALAEFAARVPSLHTPIVLQQMHGAAARVPADATAFAHRHAQLEYLILSQWMTPEDDERNIRWTRELHAALKPYADSAAYVNDLDVDEADRVAEAYGANYERLGALKKKFDPTNFFHLNHNVRPTD
jgi:FAD/FMN-containing dehydrogenase